MFALLVYIRKILLFFHLLFPFFLGISPTFLIRYIFFRTFKYLTRNFERSIKKATYMVFLIKFNKFHYIWLIIWNFFIVFLLLYLGKLIFVSILLVIFFIWIRHILRVLLTKLVPKVLILFKINRFSLTFCWSLRTGNLNNSRSNWKKFLVNFRTRVLLYFYFNW